jgi:hypothetical protein
MMQAILPQLSPRALLKHTEYRCFMTLHQKAKRPPADQFEMLAKIWGRCEVALKKWGVMRIPDSDPVWLHQVVGRWYWRWFGRVSRMRQSMPYLLEDA